MYTTGKSEIDRKLKRFLLDLGAKDRDYLFEILVTVYKLIMDGTREKDLRILNMALKELRYGFKIFEPYSSKRKVSIFGSSRAEKNSTAYRLAKDFAQRIRQEGFMVITGAGEGVMAGAQEGAGREDSFGLNILIPGLQRVNSTIDGDKKLINFYYFFTRKLMFVKESDAFCMLPGGYGTFDETFEVLTLLQTGKCDPKPVVLLDDGTGFWHGWLDYFKNTVVSRGYVYEDELVLFRCVEDVKSAVDEILRFYRRYHSIRFVDSKAIIRLTERPDERTLKEINSEFDLYLTEPVRICDPSSKEIEDRDHIDLPRVLVSPKRKNLSLIRRIIDRLNMSY